MKVIKSNRGFRFLLHDQYPPNETETRLLSESSAIGEYDNSFDIPGSSFLWVGDNHHLNREEVAEMILVAQHWLDHGNLPEPTPE